MDNQFPASCSMFFAGGACYAVVVDMLASAMHA
jgi:hypothetical protein